MKLMRCSYREWRGLTEICVRCLPGTEVDVSKPEASIHVRVCVRVCVECINTWPGANTVTTKPRAEETWLTNL